MFLSDNLYLFLEMGEMGGDGPETTQTKGCEIKTRESFGLKLLTCIYNSRLLSVSQAKEIYIYITLSVKNIRVSTYT